MASRWLCDDQWQRVELLSRGKAKDPGSPDESNRYLLRFCSE